MWAAYMAELEGRELDFGCVKPQHTHMSHALITAALESYEKQKAIEIAY